MHKPVALVGRSVKYNIHQEDKVHTELVADTRIAYFEVRDDLVRK